MRILHPLRRRPVALLWGGLSASAVGDQFYAVALTWIATGAFGAAAGYLSALQALTVLGIALLGGLADRARPLHAMLGADLLRAAALLALVVPWLHAGAPPAWGLAAVVVVLAAGQAVFAPALQAALPALVAERRLLPAANALFDGTERSARLLGPGLLALLSGSLPAVHFLTIDAATFLLSAAALWMILRGARPAAGPVPAAPPAVAGGIAPIAIKRGGIGPGGIGTGIRAMRRHPLLGYVLASAAPLNGAWYAVFFLGLPLLLREEAGGGLGTYGMLLSAYGGTNLLCNLVVGSRDMPARPQVPMFGGSLLVGAGMAAFALVGLLPEPWRLPAWLAAAALSGLAGPLKDIPVAVLRQSRLPAGEIPAAARALMAANAAGMLVAMLLVPSLMAVLPPAAVVAGCGAVACAVGAVGLLRHAGWREDSGAAGG